MQTISQMLEGVASFEPDRIGVIFENDRLTFKELNARVNRLAHGLIDRGVRPTDRVMMFMKNSVEQVVAYFAIIRAGATVVPLNVMHRGYEIEHIATDTGATSLIADTDLWSGEASVADRLPLLKLIITHGPEKLDRALHVEEVLTDRDDSPEIRAGMDDLVSIIYTSGTTGRPKGATQTHRSILTNVRGCCTRNKFSCDDRLLCALPLFNNFAINVVMMSALASAAALVIVDRFEARKVLDTIGMHKCSYFAGTPTMFSYLLEEYVPGKDDVSSLRVTNSGGAPCPPSLVEEVADRFGTAHLDGYGQTEACGFTTLNPLAGVRKANSVGPAISNIRVKIVADDGTDLPPGEIGEVAEKGDTFSVHGYWNRPEINEEVYRGGWFRSGDLGYMDEDGYLYVVDRKQDLIITGGANIYPAEVEEVLYRHPKVALAALVGVPDDVKGELAKAFIVLKQGETATEQEIINFVRGRMAKYKAPRTVEFVDSLPLGPTGKILKRELRQQVKSSTD